MNLDKTKVGLIGLITLLGVLGGNIYLSQDQLDNAYYCTATEEIGIFYGGISSTGLTAYPYEENRSGYVRCQKAGIKGVWIPLQEYAKENNIEIFKIINNDTKTYIENATKIVTIEYPNGKIYECYFHNEYDNNTIKSTSECVLIT